MHLEPLPLYAGLPKDNRSAWGVSFTAPDMAAKPVLGRRFSSAGKKRVAIPFNSIDSCGRPNKWFGGKVTSLVEKIEAREFDFDGVVSCRDYNHHEKGRPRNVFQYSPSALNSALGYEGGARSRDFGGWEFQVVAVPVVPIAQCRAQGSLALEKIDLGEKKLKERNSQRGIQSGRKWKESFGLILLSIGHGPWNNISKIEFDEWSSGSRYSSLLSLSPSLRHEAEYSTGPPKEQPGKVSRARELKRISHCFLKPNLRMSYSSGASSSWSTQYWPSKIASVRHSQFYPGFLVTTCELSEPFPQTRTADCELRVVREVRLEAFRLCSIDSNSQMLGRLFHFPLIDQSLEHGIGAESDHLSDETLFLLMKDVRNSGIGEAHISAASKGSHTDSHHCTHERLHKLPFRTPSLNLYGVVPVPGPSNRPHSRKSLKSASLPLRNLHHSFRVQLGRYEEDGSRFSRDYAGWGFKTYTDLWGLVHSSSMLYSLWPFWAPNFTRSSFLGLSLGLFSLTRYVGGEVLAASPFAYLPALPVYLLANHPSLGRNSALTPDRCPEEDASELLRKFSKTLAIGLSKDTITRAVFVSGVRVSGVGVIPESGALESAVVELVGFKKGSYIRPSRRCFKKGTTQTARDTPATTDEATEEATQAIIAMAAITKEEETTIARLPAATATE
ncbi:hypothetical protein ZIOFF_074269 (mitochondrion) [Zingiber officinale]|uniref:Uncharacterized protein n=1 Tax=Zingiber officinale TaxID=94328 RepID=A0A8J5C610_ZINOF|nr:hypothetical protein ZIOFF_074269 [Zingiber officinale]